MPTRDDPFTDTVPDDAPVDWPAASSPTPGPDPFESVDDEGGTSELAEPARSEAPVPLEAIDDDGGTDDPFEVVVPEGARPPSPDPAEVRPVVPWQTTAHIGEQTVPAVLAPSMPGSTWRGAPQDAGPGPHTIEFAGISVQATPDLLPGAPLLVLGRDVLAGRVLVEP